MVGGLRNRSNPRLRAASPISTASPAAIHAGESRQVASSFDTQPSLSLTDNRAVQQRHEEVSMNGQTTIASERRGEPLRDAGARAGGKAMDAERIAA